MTEGGKSEGCVNRDFGLKSQIDGCLEKSLSLQFCKFKLIQEENTD